MGQAEQVGNNDVMNWVWGQTGGCRGAEESPEKSVKLSWITTAAGEATERQLLVQQLIFWKKWKPAGWQETLRGQNQTTSPK